MSTFTPPNPDFHARVLRKMEGNAFMHHIGFAIQEVRAGEVRGEMILQPFHLQQFGRLHGGVVTTLADVVAGFAAYTLAPADKDVVTGEIKITYLRPGHGEKIWAVGRVLKPGRMLCFCESDIYTTADGVDTLIARASATMVNIDRAK